VTPVVPFVLASVLLVGAVAVADPFIPGDLVIYRVGDGQEALANTGGAVFVDEYTPSGTLVQSIALPTVVSGNNQPLIASETAVSEGLLNRSTDGRYILLTGYATTLPAGSSLSSSASADVPRTVGRVAYDGSVDTSTALTDFSDGNNPRSAASTDGINFWVGGADGGVRYTTLGSATSFQLSTDSKNIRAVEIFDGQLFMSSQKASIRVATVGTGLPTTAGQTITNLPGFPVTGNPNAFFFADLDDATPGVDTLYVADDTTGGGQIQKYALVGGSWVATGVVAADTVHGLTGVVTGRVVTLYTTTSGIDGTAGTLSSFVDNGGYDANISGQVVTVATALSNQTFRGVALAPEGPPAQTPTATATTPAVIAPTPTPTPTRTRAATSTPNLTPVPCVGDCDHNGKITVDELVTGVDIALSTAMLDQCPEFDCNHTQQVTVDCLVKAVNGALDGCTAQ